MKKIIVLYFSLCYLLISCGKNSSNENHIIKNDVDFASDNNSTLYDPTIYGIKPDDYIKDLTEESVTTEHKFKTKNNVIINYKATVGHLVTLDPETFKPNAKMFYIAFTAKNKSSKKRPVTFIYDGGPGTTSMYQLLGGFSPKIVQTSYPNYTPPGSYSLEDNPSSLIDKTDLVYINAVGTAYSTAIYPYRNKNFWGVDEDVQSFVNFIKKYLTKNERWDSPKYLMGLSYGTIRSPILSFFLHRNGIDLNGITLISTILDYRTWMSPVGLLPSFSAAAWHYNKITKNNNSNFEDHLDKVTKYSVNEYATFITDWKNNYEKLVSLIYKNSNTILQNKLNDKLATAKDFDSFIELLNNSSFEEAEVATQLKNIILRLKDMPDSIANNVQKFLAIDLESIKKQTQLGYKVNPLDMFSYFPSHLLEKEKKYLSFYDARNIRYNDSMVNEIDYLIQDPLMNNTASAFNAAWFMYVHKLLKYTTRSNFIPQNMFLIDLWNYKHTYPRGNITEKQKELYVGEDLAAAMNLNPNLKVFQAGGYFDFITPYFQATLDLNNLPLVNEVKKNIEIHNYYSGHLIFLDPVSRIKMKQDLSHFYDQTVYNNSQSEF